MTHAHGKNGDLATTLWISDLFWTPSSFSSYYLSFDSEIVGNTFPSLINKNN